MDLRFNQINNFFFFFFRVFKVGMSCIDEFKNQCLNQRQKIQMERAVAGAQHTFAFLCDDPVFQSGKNELFLFSILSCCVSHNFFELWILKKKKKKTKLYKQ